MSSPAGLVANFLNFLDLRSSLCYTGGDDCIVRLWKTDEGEDQEPPTAIEAGESIMTLAASVRSLVLLFTSR